jgi:hypothetical protein
MKYRELLHFDPITEIVKFDRLGDNDYREALVKTFVFSADYEKTIIPLICDNLDYTNTAETFGLQVVGNYGTGKSHLMSLVTLIAEDSNYLQLVSNENVKKHLEKIAGKYKVHRFELGNSNELWKLVCYQIDKFLKAEGVDYSMTEANSLEMYYGQLSKMLAHYEAKYPDKGFLLVIDEMLSFLKGHCDSPAMLNQDLQVLQALGQLSDHSKFRIIFGVQELIYNSPEFQFAADMLNRVNERFKQISITKQEVKFVTKERLLKKDEKQKTWIRNHLSRFTSFFNDLHANMEEYVELYPVHPAYFDNFQLVHVKNGQREILKTLSSKFSTMINEEVPETYPGIVSYDSYWPELTVPRMQTDPDVRRINEIMAIVDQKIEDNFVGPHADKKQLAHRIANACGVKILQASLETTNGVTAETLVDDLCYLDPTCFSRDFLQDVIDSTANKIVSATVGQYFEKNEFNLEYHLRIVGGVNYEQKIKDYMTQLSNEVKDSFFFNFLTEFLPIETETYRREFKIWSHSIDWISHKTMINGYIFMGNPNQRSTTHPQQHFYIYFMPIFCDANKQHGNEEDSVYFILDNISQEMKDYICLFAAAESLKAGADTSQKRYYDQYINQYKAKLRTLFNTEFKTKTQVVYRGEIQNLSPDMFNAPSKEQAVSNITSNLLEEHFCTSRPDYPKFTALRQPLTFGTNGNFDAHIKQAKQKIANPNLSSSNGEAILYGLGLLQDGKLSAKNSIYAKSIQNLISEKGEGQVVNRDEIIECFWAETHSYRSKDFGIEADFEYLVLATMVALGEIEIDVSGKIINAANIGEIVNCPKEDYYCFNCIRRPRGIDIAAIRELSLGITGKDLSGLLDDPSAISELLNGSRTMAERCARAIHDLQDGMSFEGVELISSSMALTMHHHLDAIKGISDRMQSFNSKAKLRNFPFSQQQIADIFSHLVDLKAIEKVKEHIHVFSALVSYLNQAKQYITDPELATDIDRAIHELDAVDINDANAIEKSKRQLNQLKERYADWYIAQYKKYHITNLEEAERTALLASPKYTVLDMATESNYVAIAPRLDPWKRDIQMLKPADSISKQQILSTPYRNFNPRDYKDVELPKLDELKHKLDEIYQFADDAYHTILQDENLLKNVDALDDRQRKLLNDFANMHIETATFPPLMQIVQTLTRGVNRVQISYSEITSIFSRQLTPDEAVREFERLINNKVGAANRNNTRITFE